MNAIRLSALAVALATVFTAGAVMAQASATQPPVTSPAAAPTASSSATTAISSHDRRFVTTAAEAGAAEVAMAELAKDHAASAAVKDFAARMVSDHEKAGDELKAIATSKGLEPSAQLSKKDQAGVDRLSKLQGPAFDKAYVNGQLAAHKDAVALFGSESKTGKDTDLKQFAASTLPTLQDHLQMVQQLAEASATQSLRTTDGAKS
jgi:putative membrane protein